jgi:hypothetical protein
MNATVTYRGRTYKSVQVQAPFDADRESVIDAALVAARETRGSLFGINVSTSNGDNGFIWHVTLNTD